MHLKAIRVSGYRSLADIGWIPITDITVLTGVNDGGKTAFLSAVRELFDQRLGVSFQDYTKLLDDTVAQEICIEAKLILDEVEQKDLKESIPLFEEYLFGDNTVFLRKFVTADPPQGLQQIKKLCFPDERIEKVIIRPPQRVAEITSLCEEHGIDISGCTNNEQRIEVIKQWRQGQSLVEKWVEVPNVLRQVLPLVEVFSSESALNPVNEINKHLKAYFPELLRREEYGSRIEEIQEQITTELYHEVQKITPAVKRFLPEIEDVVIRPQYTFDSGLGPCSLELKRKGGQPVDLTVSGAGLKRRLSLAVMEWSKDLLSARSEQSRSLILIFDEPDSHLDYLQQRRLFELIKQYAQLPGVQVIVATHSLNLIDKVPLQNINHFRLKSSYLTEVERFTIEDASMDELEAQNLFLYGISQSMGLKNSILLNEKCFLVVEGDTEMQALPVLFYKLYEIQILAAGICLINGEGNDGVRKIAKHLHKMHRNLLFLLDKDAEIFNPDSLIRDGFDIDTQVHYIGTKEFEDAFSDAIWARTANKYWPKVDGSRWTEKEFSALRNSSGKFSEELSKMLGRLSRKSARKKDMGYYIALEVNSDEIPESIKNCFKKALELCK